MASSNSDSEDDWGEPIYPDSVGPSFAALSLHNAQCAPAKPKPAPFKASGKDVTIREPIPKRFHHDMIKEDLDGLRRAIPGVYVHFPERKENSDQVDLRGSKARVEEMRQALSRLREKYQLREANGDPYIKRFLSIPPQLQFSVMGIGGANINNRVHNHPDVGAITLEFPLDGVNDQVSIEGRQSRVEAALRILRQLCEEAQQSHIKFRPKSWNNVGDKVPPREEKRGEVEESQAVNGYLKVSIPVAEHLIGPHLPLAAEMRRLRLEYPDVNLVARPGKPLLKIGARIHLLGEAKEAEKVRSALLSFLAQLEESPTSQHVELSLPTPQEFFAHIIGSSGSHIRQIEAKFPSVSIQCCTKLCAILMGGPEKEVEGARKAIRASILELDPDFAFAREWGRPVAEAKVLSPQSLPHRSASPQTSTVTLRLSAPGDLFGAVIGNRGCYIRTFVAANPDIRIHFEPKASEIVVSGPRRRLGVAKTWLRSSLRRFDPGLKFGPEWALEADEDVPPDLPSSASNSSL